MITIGQNRECFFDDYLIDTEKTTAALRLHHPQKRECVLTLDQPWEGDYCGYYNFFFDEQYSGFEGKHPEGVYRMYYLGRRSDYSFSSFGKENVAGGACVCYAESVDGLHWIRPQLGIFAWNGDLGNNIVLDKSLHPDIDNFYVFRDDNPACPAAERYKGICAFDEPKKPDGEKGEFRLFVFFSPDGIHFTIGHMLTNKGFFDSLDIILWDEEAGLYRGFVRGIHQKGQPPQADSAGALHWDKMRGALNDAGRSEEPPEIVRDILYIESKDFRSWSNPVWLRYDDGKEIQMYTNNISKYFRAPQMYIGFPTRYIERQEWNGSFEELGGLTMRRRHMEEGSQRAGMAMTDGAFMTSRDGIHFHRFGNAFFRNGAENGRNWCYGDGYCAYGLAVTPSSDPGAPQELSLYMDENHGMGIPNELYRYTIRMDGFVSLHAEGEEVLIVTRPFVYDGKELFLNFSTSAYGYLYVTLITEDGERYESCETFGDAIDRRIHFEEDVVARFSGQPVRMEVRMLDGDLYTMQFRK